MKGLFTLVCTCLLLLFFSSSAKAQFIAGVKTGLTHSNIPFKHKNFLNGYLYGTQAGVFTNLELYGVVNVQPELLYVEKGGEYKQGAFWFKERRRYIEIPLLLQLYSGDTLHSVRYYMEAGPHLSFLLSTQEEMRIQEEQESRLLGTTTGTSGSLGSVNLGFDLGVGALVKLGKQQYLNANVRITNDQDNFVLGGTVAYMFSIR